MKKDEKIKNYKEWMKSKEAKKNLKKGFIKSGVPLELNVRKTFSDRKYTVSEYRYKDRDEDTDVWRQLDILARKFIDGYMIDDYVDVKIELNLLIECKHSSSKDFFVFRTKNVGNVTDIPIILSGHSLLIPYNFIEFKKFPLVDNVREVDVSKPFVKDKRNYNDKITNYACHQLVGAMQHLVNSRYEMARDEYRTIRNWLPKDFRQQYNDFIQETPKITQGGLQIVPRIAKEGFFRDAYKKTKKDHFSRIRYLYPSNYYSIELCLPILVIDDVNGLIDVLPNKTETEVIHRFKDLGYCLYFFTSQNPDKYKMVFKKSFICPIFICNFRYLPKLITDIETVIKKIAKKSREHLKSSPWLLLMQFIDPPKIFDW